MFVSKNEIWECYNILQDPELISKILAVAHDSSKIQRKDQINQNIGPNYTIPEKDDFILNKILRERREGVIKTGLYNYDEKDAQAFWTRDILIEFNYKYYVKRNRAEDDKFYKR